MKAYIRYAAYFLILAPLAMNTHAAKAGTLNLGVTLASKHFFAAPEEIGEFQEENLGLEAEYNMTDTVFISAGRYDNSVGDRSTVIGIGKELESGIVFGFPLRAGLELGIADGYEKLIEANDDVPTTGDYLLMGGGYIRIGGDNAFKFRYMVVLMAVSYQHEF